MIGPRSIALALSAALLLSGAAPLTSQEAPTAVDYARREAPELAEFQGGFHGVVVAAIILTALVGCLIFVVEVDCPSCWHGHRHRLPPAEGRGHPRP